MTKSLPSPECLHEILRYNPETGKLFWQERPIKMFATERAGRTWNAQWADSEAFTKVDSRGYNCSRIFGKRFRAHQVVWAMHYMLHSDCDIDHINGIRTDNRIKNLRKSSSGENQRNAKMRITNKSGYTGVMWCPRRKKWRAAICVNGKQKTLGEFSSLDDAVKHRKSAEKKCGYSERHGL